MPQCRQQPGEDHREERHCDREGDRCQVYSRVREARHIAARELNQKWQEQLRECHAGDGAKDAKNDGLGEQ